MLFKTRPDAAEHPDNKFDSYLLPTIDPFDELNTVKETYQWDLSWPNNVYMKLKNV